MACSKLTAQTTKIRSELKLLGKTEVEWEIVGWNGPFSHQMRSNASCCVTVPTSNTCNSGTKLCFHLKPYQCHNEITQNFCTKKNNYVSRSISCKCSTCATVPLKTTAKLPAEFLPETGTQSAGYSLLVDVLTPQTQAKIMLVVSVEKLNGQKCTVSNKAIFLEPGSESKDLVVKSNFWRMLLWTVDDNEHVGNFRNTLADTVDDASFHLTVAAYEIVSSEIKSTVNCVDYVTTGKEALKHTIAQITKSLEKRRDIVNKTDASPVTMKTLRTDDKDYSTKTTNTVTDSVKQTGNSGLSPDDESSVVVKCHYTNSENEKCVNVMQVFKAPLYEKSEFFRRELDKLGNQGEIDWHSDPNALQVVLDWIADSSMSTALHKESKVEEILDLAFYLELDNTIHFLSELEEHLIKQCDSLSVAKNLWPVAEEHALTRLMEHINRNFPTWSTLRDIQRELLSNYNEGTGITTPSVEVSMETASASTLNGQNGVVIGTPVNIAKSLHQPNLPEKTSETGPISSNEGSSKSADFYDMLSSNGSESSFEVVQDTKNNTNRDEDIRKLEENLKDLMQKLQTLKNNM